MLRSTLLGAVDILACCSPSFAHVTLENEQAPVGSAYKAVLQVSPGCGDSPTTAIRVRIPEGIVAVKSNAQGGMEA